MSISDQQSHSDRLITCILPKGVASAVQKKLKLEKGLTRVNINSARGSGKITPLAYRGIAGQAEKEMLNIVVSSELADEIFDYVYVEAEINRPHGGLMYMGRLSHATPMILPDLPTET